MIDLVRNAREGLHFLTHNVDRRRNCLPFFVTKFKDDPAEARHDWPDFGDLTGRYVEALHMARDMTGSDEGEQVRRALTDNLLSWFSEGDGLNYRPKPDKSHGHTDYSGNDCNQTGRKQILLCSRECH